MSQKSPEREFLGVVAVVKRSYSRAIFRSFRLAPYQSVARHQLLRSHCRACEPLVRLSSPELAQNQIPASAQRYRSFTPGFTPGSDPGSRSARITICHTPKWENSLICEVSVVIARSPSHSMARLTYLLAKARVAGSNPVSRSILSNKLRRPCLWVILRGDGSDLS